MIPAMEQQQEEPGALCLQILKGPRAGKTLQCEANNRKNKLLKIGRTLRGNTFAIRDSGISQKHLLIQLDSTKWEIQDLNTSNGTIPNDFVLPPLEFRPLHDVGIIKIGEETVLCVKIARKVENAIPSPDARVLRAGNKRKECDMSGFEEDLVRTSDVAEKEDNDVRVSGEIMMLRQWFDQMEEWIPMDLNAVAEKCIIPIKADAAKFDEYVQQHKA